MKTSKLMKKLAIWGIVYTSPLWPIWLSIPQEIVRTMWPKIESIQEAQKIIDEEKIKLGINNPVELRIYDKGELREIHSAGYCAKNTNSDGFVIGANKRDLTRILIRHELYHLKRDIAVIAESKSTKQEDIRFLKKQDEDGFNPKYFYLMEPRANLYSISGIKL